MKKILIITGGNRGLGKAIIDLALKDLQTTIITISRKIHEEHERINKDKLIYIQKDLSDKFSHEIIQVLNKNITKNAVIFFINNASIIMPVNGIGCFRIEEIESSIKVNVQFPVCLINSLIKEFTENEINLVNISSGAGINPIQYWSLYGASKAYLNMFFNVLKIEKNKNIKVYDIDPGVLDTGMQKELRETYFPNQDYFISLEKENKLKKPETAAKEILNKINY